tara:strand:+ start:925 stop:1191 length:267 start_codon:yes stop_codon:yes gene_type:complete
MQTFAVNLSAEDIFKLSQIISTTDGIDTSSISEALEQAQIDVAYEEYSSCVLPDQGRLSKDEFITEYTSGNLIIEDELMENVELEDNV